MTIRDELLKLQAQWQDDIDGEPGAITVAAIAAHIEALGRVLAADGAQGDPAKVIVVTELMFPNKTHERRYPADEIRHHPDAGVIELYRDGRRVALYNHDTWASFRDEDAEVPGAGKRKLDIALAALSEICDEPHAGFSPARAASALADIADVDL